MWPNYPGAEFFGQAFKFRQRKENSPSCAHVLQKTLNLVISRRSFAENGKEMYQNALTCRSSVMLIKTYCFVTFSLASPTWLCKIRRITTTATRAPEVEIHSYSEYFSHCRVLPTSQPTSFTFVTLRTIPLGIHYFSWDRPSTQATGPGGRHLGTRVSRIYDVTEFWRHRPISVSWGPFLERPDNLSGP